jgi:hypothetical protein
LRGMGAIVPCCNGNSDQLEREEMLYLIML